MLLWGYQGILCVCLKVSGVFWVVSMVLLNGCQEVSKVFQDDCTLVSL